MIKNNHDNEDCFFQLLSHRKSFRGGYACCILEIHRPQALSVGEIPPHSTKCPNIRPCHRGHGAPKQNTTCRYRPIHHNRARTLCTDILYRF